MIDLPDGWAEATVDELSTLVQYGSSAKTSERAAGVPVLRMGNIVEGRLNLDELKYLPPNHSEFPDLLLQPQDILFNRTNSPELVGKTAVYEGRPAPCSFASYLLRIRLRDYEPKLLSYYINSTHGRRWISSVVNQQVGQANVNGSKLRELSVPTPPLKEQHRIVTKLEALTAKSRRAKEALDAIPPLIERFRQSVLAAAFRGDLTAAWREKNPDVEPAEKLLARIRVERRRRWEEGELAKMRAKGKVPGDDRWKEKYEELEPTDVEGPELPEGWCWVALGQIAEVIDPNPSHRYPTYENGTVSLVSTREFHERESWDTQNTPLVPEHVWQEQDVRCRFSPDDIIFARKGRLGLARRPPLGRYVFSHTMFVIKCEWPCSEYLLWHLRRDSSISWLSMEMNSNTGVPTLGKAFLEKLPVPLAPLAEQSVISRLVSAQFRRQDSVAKDVDSAKAATNHLDKAILSKAFRGELVPQDPTDEPASALLERIRAERSAAPASPRKRSPRASASRT